MAKEVFISYRRDDSAGTTGRIYDRLVSSLPKHRIFMDVDASMHGLDFARVLDEKIGSSDLVAVVIGPNWLTAKNPDGDRRIDTQDDFVRIEVSAALKRGVPVIPILVDGASMPTELDLPNELKPLTRRHAIELRNTRFADDADKLVKAVTERLGAKRRRLWRFAASTAGLIMLAAAALIAHQKGFFAPGSVFSILLQHDDRPVVGDAKRGADRESKQQEAQAERERYRERIRQLEFEAEIRKLRREREQEREQLRREEERRQMETERNRIEEERIKQEAERRREEEQSSTADVSSLPVCEQLWRQRNAIFHKFGYCFSTPKGQAVFGNDNCSRDMNSTWRAMGEDNRNFIKRVQEQERLNAC